MHQAISKLFLQQSKDACKDVYDLLTSPRQKEDFETLFVGEGGDDSIRIDVKAEAIFFEYFLPHFAVYSEESGKKGENDYIVILDPIDGSDNLVTHFPYYGASMALQYKGTTIAGVVVNFANADLFYRDYQSVLFKVSLHNNRVLKVHKNSHAKIGIFEKSAHYTKKVDSLIKNKLKFRSPGAVALSLVYAYDVRYVIFLGPKRPFDLEAGLFLVAGLEVYEDDETIIITHDTVMLEQIKQIILEDI